MITTINNVMEKERVILGISFLLKDNGVQTYYTCASNGVTYDIARNYGSDIWWVWAHKKGMTKTLNFPPVSGTFRPELGQPGLLFNSADMSKDSSFWLNKVAVLVKSGVNPFA
jgi:hypothetical protein